MIDPYGPMTNMRPIQSKQWTAGDIKRMQILVCASCGRKVQEGKGTNLCPDCTQELLIEIHNEIGAQREGEA